MDLHKETTPQKRGIDFEGLLTGLFDAYELMPRMGYTVASDQIVGAISFDSDDYIVEAKWTASPVERSTADIFATKVARAGKNGLGLFVSTSGFSAGFKETYSRSTPFITMDGVDLFAVLDGRIGLDDLLRAKKRHANETGSCFLPVGELTQRGPLQRLGRHGEVTAQRLERASHPASAARHAKKLRVGPPQTWLMRVSSGRNP